MKNHPGSTKIKPKTKKRSSFFLLYSPPGPCITYKKQIDDNIPSSPRLVDYKEYLTSPRWYALRDAICRQAKYICVACGSNNQLDVHHMSYANLGNERFYELVCLCHVCHNALHKCHKADEDLFIHSIYFIRKMAGSVVLEYNLEQWLYECKTAYPKHLKTQKEHMLNIKPTPKPYKKKKKRFYEDKKVFVEHKRMPMREILLARTKNS